MGEHPTRYDCEECGEGIDADEDGCCLSCGRDATVVEVPGGCWVLMTPQDFAEFKEWQDSDPREAKSDE